MRIKPYTTDRAELLIGTYPVASISDLPTIDSNRKYLVQSATLAPDAIIMVFRAHFCILHRPKPTHAIATATSGNTIGPITAGGSGRRDAKYATALIHTYESR